MQEISNIQKTNPNNKITLIHNQPTITKKITLKSNKLPQLTRNLGDMIMPNFPYFSRMLSNGINDININPII